MGLIDQYRQIAPWRQVVYAICVLGVIALVVWDLVDEAAQYTTVGVIVLLRSRSRCAPAASVARAEVTPDSAVCDQLAQDRDAEEDDQERQVEHAGTGITRRSGASTGSFTATSPPWTVARAVPGRMGNQDRSARAMRTKR